VITVEDPVEYRLSRVTQIQVNPKAGLTFALGLRHILRQDPDIIMVGEIRDVETLQMAIQASLTGHLVFSTVHCNDAAAAAARLIDMGTEPFLITSSIIGIIAQRLVRCICPACREPYTPSEELLARLGLKQNGSIQFYRGPGCGECRGTGYHGRTSVFEILLPDQAIKNAILKRDSAGNIRLLARQSGARSLQEDGFEKVLTGVTTVEELLRAVYVEEE
jgi:type II secretory ATPase GspE/PulE/Tfp pilus assembly ATPase PilB-like protein